MTKRYVNHSENFEISKIDGSGSQSDRIEPSSITRSPEQAMNADIELLAFELVKKDPKMLQMIEHDLHLAQHGMPDQIKEVRQRLVKAGVPASWPAEVLGVVETRLKEAKTQVPETDYLKDPKYKDFHKLFEQGSQN